MRPGRVLSLIGVAAAMITAGAHAPPDAILRNQQLLASAVLHLGQGRNRLAIEELSQVVVSKALSRPDQVRALYDRGVAYDSIGDTRAALNDYGAALKLDPRFAPALNNRANAYRRMGRLAEARRDYLAALAAPGAAREYAYFGLGQIAELRGDATAARGAYHKALAANPAFAQAALSIVALDKRAQEAAVASAPQQPDVIVPPRPQSAAFVLSDANPAAEVQPQDPPRPRVTHQMAVAPVNPAGQAQAKPEPVTTPPAHVEPPAPAEAKREPQLLSVVKPTAPEPAVSSAVVVRAEPKGVTGHEEQTPPAKLEEPKQDVIATSIVHPELPAPAKHDVPATRVAKPNPPAPARSIPVRLANTDPVLRRAIVDVSKRNAGGAQIQLGAYREQEMASQAWSKIEAASGGALKGLSPLTVSVDLPGKGRFWRLRAAVPDRVEARRICSALVGQGQDCLVARD